MATSRFMREALRLAARAKGNTSPNPLVGAVVVRDNAIVGRGFHARAGAAHAEAVALLEAGESARGALLYVTLEPCAHHGRTPPCVDAIASAGIAQVIVAMQDPDEKMRGAGIRALRGRGIETQSGDGADDALRLNRAYDKHRTTGRPFVTLKMAQSLDGFAARRSGERTQLTGAEAAKFVRQLRYEHDAVMIGVGTATADDPQLTVRPYKQRAVPFTRIVLDSRGRISPRLRLIRDQKRARTIIATTPAISDAARAALEKRGVEVLVTGADAQGRIDLNALLATLGGRGMLSVLCEGGPTVASALLAEHLVDALCLLVAPVILGAGHDVVPAFKAIEDMRVHVDDVLRLGVDTLISATTEVPTPSSPA